MSGSVIFVDTNVYFYAHDRRQTEKQAVCRNWLRMLGLHRQGVANLQAANEFADVALRKMRHLPEDVVFRLADDILEWGNSALSPGAVASARSIRSNYRYSWWDCLLLASALELGCTHFLSEDLQDGQDVGGLTIVDPFAHTPDQILISR